MDESEEGISSEDSEQLFAVPGNSVRRKWRDTRRLRLEELRSVAREGARLLEAAVGDAQQAEGAARRARPRILFGLPESEGSEQWSAALVTVADSGSVLRERRVLRMRSAAFEVREGSGLRSFQRKVATGTHRRELWCINDEFIVTKEVRGAHCELCREHLHRVTSVADVSNTSQTLLAVTFASGFVFTAHLESQSLLRRWMDLLNSRDTFPYGVSFEDWTQSSNSTSNMREHLPPTLQRQGSGSNAAPPKRIWEAKLKELDADTAAGIREDLVRAEGLMNAQEAALQLVEGDDTTPGVTARSTYNRQMRIQRILMDAMKELQHFSLDLLESLQDDTNNNGTAAEDEKKKRPVRTRRRRRRSSASFMNDAAGDAWSESDDSSSADHDADIDEDVFFAPIDKPQPLVLPPPPAFSPGSGRVQEQLQEQQEQQHHQSPQPQRVFIPPPPSVSPRVVILDDSDSEVAFLRRQLALKDLELTKMRSQLTNLVNDTWRKNLQVAELKKGSALQIGEELKQRFSLPLTLRRTGLRSEGEVEVLNRLSVEGRIERASSSSSPSFVAVSSSLTASRLLAMPPDVLRKVLCSLAIADLGAFCQASRRARECVLNDRVIWNVQLARLLPPKATLPQSVSSLGSFREQVKVLVEQYFCAGCGTFLPFGPPDSFSWEKFQLPLCRRSECFRAATLTGAEAASQFAMTEEELRSMPDKVRSGVARDSFTVVFRRRDVLLAAHAKYGGAAGLQARIRALSKIKQLRALSKLGHITTRPVDLLL